jgi:hypothetical protein
MVYYSIALVLMTTNYEVQKSTLQAAARLSIISRFFSSVADALLMIGIANIASSIYETATKASGIALRLLVYFLAVAVSVLALVTLCCIAILPHCPD